MLHMIQVRNFLQKIRKLGKPRPGMSTKDSPTSTGSGTNGARSPAQGRRVGRDAGFFLVSRAACGTLGVWLCVMLMKRGKLCAQAGPSG